MPVSSRLPPARALLVALLFATSPAWADFKRDYALGLAAAGDGKWSEVETLMRSAMKDSAEPQAKVRLYGTHYDAYVPQYYLGLVAAKRGDCAAALQAWDDAATRSIVESNSTLSGPFADGVRECKGKLAQSGTPTTPPTTVASNPPPSTTTKPPVTTTPVTTNPATTTTTPTNPSTTTTVASNPTTTTTATTPPKPPTPPPAPPTPASTSDAPPELVSALDNFLAGRYTQAAQVNPAQISDLRTRYHALLVRAAARYTQSLINGDAGAAMLAGAQDDVRAAKALQPTQVPDPAIYSPRFKQFYQQVR